MLVRSLTTMSTLLIAALGIASGSAHAAPTDPPAPVGFTAEVVDGHSVVTTDSGSMVVEDGTFKIKAADGTVVAGTPLTFRLDEFEFPIAAEISGHTATLTPQLDPDRAVYRPAALPHQETAPWKTPYDREVAAFTRLKDTIATGAAIGTAVGGLGGAAVGCVLGGIAGATVAAATIVGLFGPFVPAAVIGCLGGIVAIGALGTVAGQLFVTAPVIIGAVIQYVTTINEPFPPNGSGPAR
ncbi:hypothetical protein NLM24_05550 [Nocardia zapadnayensis]|uniref:hypothetical protein n=1 Tax=Nocardia rhamnosiphila TaxID=426716 RepID=UPI0022463146|nr:hypothetical protein [Nocardia zapadnayensis]MCX0270177.1 hypothetical protein [Nocardia zapadnayensis]